MKTLILRVSRLLATLPLAVLAAENNPASPPSPLPEVVADAVAAGDCEQLIALNKRYHAAASADDSAVIAVLEDAILALPACGEVDAGLVRVEPICGVNFFDPQSPLGTAR